MKVDVWAKPLLFERLLGHLGERGMERAAGVAVPGSEEDTDLSTYNAVCLYFPECGCVIYTSIYTIV